MAESGLTSLQGAIFVQPGGPNTDVQYLGSCHQITNLSWDEGTNTLMHCGDPVQPNRFRVSRKIKGPPGLVTFDVQSEIQQVISYIQQFRCPAPIIVTNTMRAPKNQHVNWDVAFIITNADPVSRSYENLVGKEENNMVLRTTTMEADEIIELYPLKPYRQSIAETQALNHVFACDFDICGGMGQARNDKCDTLYAVSDAVSGSAAGTASVWKFTESGWAALPADPFDTDEDISTGTCFILDRETTRILVFRGTTDPSNPAEAAYSDDGGATWTTVNIGSVNGEYVPNAHSVHALDRNHIWVGTDGGRIYFSGNGGESWTVQEDATIHAGAWNWIEMLDSQNGFAGGAGDVTAITADGGESWSQLNATGNGGDIIAGAAIDTLRAWVGTDDGDLFYTIDGGATWHERGGWAGSGTGDVKAIRFYGDQVGLMVHEDAGGQATFLLTKSGGRDWETIETPTNSGINSLMLCTPLLAYAVGEAHGGTAMAYKLQPKQAG